MGWPGVLGLGLLFALALLGPQALGACGCTMFLAGAGLAILAAGLLGGNSVYGALTGEREKKTLDSLRLTQLSPSQVILGKLSGEWVSLGRLLLITAPALLVAGALSDAGLAGGVGAVALVALAGLFASVSGIYLSSVAATTSQAVLMGWILKAVWLLGTPILDAVLAAVLVQSRVPPVFSSLNPLAALGVLAIPEGATGARSHLFGLALLALPAATLLLGWQAARRYASDPGRGPALVDGQTHRVYRGAWAPAFIRSLLPSLGSNASFLREMAFQVRTGAGGWPGYLVFLVLFLAPFVYARTWAEKKEVPYLTGPAGISQTVVVSERVPLEMTAGLQVHEPSSPGRRTYLYSYGNEALILEGHSPRLCLRMTLYTLLGLPLPRQRVKVLAFEHQRSSLPVVSEQPLDDERARRFGLEDLSEGDTAPLTTGELQAARGSALHVGIAGAVVLFLLYLSIRCSGFLAGALTGERDRRSWEDLALTGMPASEVLCGKLAGALALPLWQMTVTFPALLFFVFNGGLSVWEIGALYAYALGLAATAGMLGLWCSARSATTHDSHGMALGLVLLAFLALPAVKPAAGFLIGLALLVAVASAARGLAYAAGWAGIALGLVLAPSAPSPLTAALSFMPSLSLHSGSVMRLFQAYPVSGPEALLHLAGSLLVMASLFGLLYRATLDRVAAGRDEALRAEPAA
jgi:ABC-type Na+ efflux pump permease subunit